MKLIRFIVGKLILFISALTLPSKEKRSEENKKQIKEKLASLSLYQFEACPFCVKVRRAMYKLDLDIELINSKEEPGKSELLEQGGRLMVPCLRIQDDEGETWMYESGDIISYLEQEFPVA